MKHSTFFEECAILFKLLLFDAFVVAFVLLEKKKREKDPIKSRVLIPDPQQYVEFYTFARFGFVLFAPHTPH
jgi:hypothetical protein